MMIIDKLVSHTTEGGNIKMMPSLLQTAVTTYVYISSLLNLADTRSTSRKRKYDHGQ